jgi:hypothetical protein
MKVNDVVFQDYQGIRRFGVVKNVEIKTDSWAYADVAWANDGKYVAAMSYLTELRGEDLSRHQYRTDEVKVIDAHKEIDTLQICLAATEENE